MAVRTSCGPSAVSNRPLKKVLRPDGALALGTDRIDLTIERQQTGRQFGGRIGEGDGAAKRAAVTDRGVADMRHGARDQGRVFGDQLGAFGLGMAHQRAELDLAVFVRDAAESADAVDVD